MQFQFVFKLFHDCGLFLVAIPYISLKKELRWICSAVIIFHRFSVYLLKYFVSELRRALEILCLKVYTEAQLRI